MRPLTFVRGDKSPTLDLPEGEGTTYKSESCHVNPDSYREETSHPAFTVMLFLQYGLTLHAQRDVTSLMVGTDSLHQRNNLIKKSPNKELFNYKKQLFLRPAH